MERKDISDPTSSPIAMSAIPNTATPIEETVRSVQREGGEGKREGDGERESTQHL